MRAPVSLFLLTLLCSHPSLADEVRVRIYSAHPPGALTITATKGQLHWKSCLDCEQHTESRLLFPSPANATNTGGSGGQREMLLTGSYKLHRADGPVFSAEFPLRLQNRPGGLMVIATMPMEEYVERVLMAESGDFQNGEALKAMAVAARTYAKRFAGQHAAEGFDFCDTTHCQALYWKKSKLAVHSAVESTQGEILLYQGHVAATYYHQNCGGSLAAADEAWPQVSEPYLAAHADPFCRTSGGLQWQATLSLEQIDRALQESGVHTPKAWKGFEVDRRSRSGRVHSVVLSGGVPNRFSLSASSFRFAVNRVFGWNNIRSDLYELHSAGQQVIFSGRGAGHGVGLCQAGAEEMAREGKNYREILAFYYPNTELARPPQQVWQKRSDERFDLISSNPEADSQILTNAKYVLQDSERSVGWSLSTRVRLQVFPTLESYRDTTGQPGWVAASTRGSTIRLQPLVELRRRSILESTLRHEIFHLLVEARASAKAPLWFREGLVLYLSKPEVPDAAYVPLGREQIEHILQHGDSQENTRRAYVCARRIVATLVLRYGKREVLSWLNSGLPVGVTSTVNEGLALPANR
jgi:stage II sporulation protein D